MVSIVLAAPTAALPQTGAASRSIVGQTGERQNRDDLAGRIKPLRRVANRIENRISTRIESRIEKDSIQNFESTLKVQEYSPANPRLN